MTKIKLMPIVITLTFALLSVIAYACNPCTSSCSSKQIYVSIPDGVYVNNNPNAWLKDSWVYYSDYAPNKVYTFNLEIKNTKQSEKLNVTLIMAIPKTTTADDLSSITLSGGEFGSLVYYVSSFDNKTFCTPAGGHGVYPPSGNARWIFYPVGEMNKNTTKNITVTVKLGPEPSENFKIHFDLNASAKPCTSQKYFNPPSHDSTFAYKEGGDPGIPEFSSMVLPIVLSIASFGVISLKKKNFFY